MGRNILIPLILTLVIAVSGCTGQTTTTPELTADTEAPVVPETKSNCNQVPYQYEFLGCDHRSVFEQSDSDGPFKTTSTSTTQVFCKFKNDEAMEGVFKYDITVYPHTIAQAEGTPSGEFSGELPLEAFQSKRIMVGEVEHGSYRIVEEKITPPLKEMC